MYFSDVHSIKSTWTHSWNNTCYFKCIKEGIIIQCLSLYLNGCIGYIVWFVESKNASFSCFAGIVKFVNRFLYLLMCFVLKGLSVLELFYFVFLCWWASWSVTLFNGRQSNWGMYSVNNTAVTWIGALQSF